MGYLVKNLTKLSRSYPYGQHSGLPCAIRRFYERPAITDGIHYNCTVSNLFGRETTGHYWRPT